MMHCLNLGVEALALAITNYQENKIDTLGAPGRLDKGLVVTDDEPN